MGEVALYTCLKQSHLARATLYIYEQELYTVQLCDLPNLSLTLHVVTLKKSRAIIENGPLHNILDHFDFLL